MLRRTLRSRSSLPLLDVVSAAPQLGKLQLNPPITFRANAASASGSASESANLDPDSGLGTTLDSADLGSDPESADLGSTALNRSAAIVLSRTSHCPLLINYVGIPTKIEAIRDLQLPASSSRSSVGRDPDGSQCRLGISLPLWLQPPTLACFCSAEASSKIRTEHTVGGAAHPFGPRPPEHNHKVRILQSLVPHQIQLLPATEKARVFNAEFSDDLPEGVTGVPEGREEEGAT